MKSSMAAGAKSAEKDLSQAEKAETPGSTWFWCAFPRLKLLSYVHICSYGNPPKKEVSPCDLS